MSWSMQSIRESDVPASDVFALYIDPSTWGDWAHNTAWGRARGPIQPGAEVDVRVRSYPWTYTVRVLEVEPGRRIVTEVRPFGVRIVSSYEVTPTATGSRLHHVIRLDGFLERAYRLVEGRYTRMLEQETRRVAELAAGGRGSDPRVVDGTAISQA